MKIVYSPKYLEHGSESHPECPARAESAYNYLKAKGFSFESPELVLEKDLLVVHRAKLLSQLKMLSRRSASSGDNIFKENTFEIAKLAAGGALKAARLAEREFAFALVRPPGHHAGKDFFGGFCYLNNLAFFFF